MLDEVTLDRRIRLFFRACFALAVIGLFVLLLGCLNLNGGRVIRLPKSQEPVTSPSTINKPKPLPPTCPSCGEPIWQNQEHACPADAPADAYDDPYHGR